MKKLLILPFLSLVLGASSSMAQDTVPLGGFAVPQDIVSLGGFEWDSFATQYEVRVNGCIKGTPCSRTFSLKNSGSSTITINVTESGPVSLSVNSCQNATLVPGQYCYFTLIYTLGIYEARTWVGPVSISGVPAGWKVQGNGPSQSQSSFPACFAVNDYCS